jgi:dTDP-4-amino-4,6-dideoxygalactose transaminase
MSDAKVGDMPRRLVVDRRAADSRTDSRGDGDMTDSKTSVAEGSPAAVVRFQAPDPPPLDAIAPYFQQAEEQRWYSNNGPCLKLLEERVSAYVGDVHTLGVCNATLGLMVALREAALPGRNVVALPSWTFVATAAAVAWCGLRPLFLDVDPVSWQMDPSALEDVLGIRDDVAAVLACSTFGTAPPTSMRRRWEGACSAAGVPLIVDSAAGFGALDDEGRLLGRQGVTEIFSLHATKPFAVGEGGLLLTTSADRRQRLGLWANFGFDAGRSVQVPGLNAKMSELAAATALAALDGLDAAIAGRRRLAEGIREALLPLGYLAQAGAVGSAVQFVPLLAQDSAIRERVLEAAAEARIEVRSYYDVPCHRLAPYADAERYGALAVTEDLSRRALSLPMANDLSDAQLFRIVDLCQRAAT